MIDHTIVPLGTSGIQMQISRYNRRVVRIAVTIASLIRIIVQSSITIFMEKECVAYMVEIHMVFPIRVQILSIGQNIFQIDLFRISRRNIIKAEPVTKTVSDSAQVGWSFSTLLTACTDIDELIMIVDTIVAHIAVVVSYQTAALEILRTYTLQSINGKCF